MNSQLLERHDLPTPAQPARHLHGTSRFGVRARDLTRLDARSPHADREQSVLEQVMYIGKTLRAQPQQLVVVAGMRLRSDDEHFGIADCRDRLGKLTLEEMLDNPEDP